MRDAALRCRVTNEVHKDWITAMFTKVWNDWLVSGNYRCLIDK